MYTDLVSYCWCDRCGVLGRRRGSKFTSEVVAVGSNRERGSFLRSRGTCMSSLRCDAMPSGLCGRDALVLATFCDRLFRFFSSLSPRQHSEGKVSWLFWCCWASTFFPKSCKTMRVVLSPQILHPTFQAHFNLPFLPFLIFPKFLSATPKISRNLLNLFPLSMEEIVELYPHCYFRLLN